jgi:Protein of unknown function (DUF3037)
MAAHYSVIQYLPDPAIDERINFGVVVVGEPGELHARFVRNWRRVESFGGSDTGFLRTFAREVQETASAQAALPLGDAHLSHEALLSAVENWRNSIQFTPLRGSIFSAQELVDEVAKRFLRERVARTRKGRDRRAAARAAVQSLEEGLRALGSRRPEKYVTRNEVVVGDLDEHSFDVALTNGEVQFGVLAMSFEGQSVSDLMQEISANAWTIDDVKRSSGDFPISVVTLPPRSRSKTYDHAVELFRNLDAQVVEESEVEDWAADVAAEMYDYLVPARR